VVPLAWRMIAKDRARFLVTVAGVGFTSMLMLFLLGVYEGVKAESNGYARQRPAELWISQSNSTNLIRSTSLLSSSLGEGIGAIGGVGSLAPLLRTIGTSEIRGKSVTFFILGIDPAQPATAPLVVEGTALIRRGEIILDRSFAAKHRLGISDTVHVQERAFRVVGLSTGTNAVVTQFNFLTLGDARELMGVPDLVSFWLASVTDGTPARDVADSIRARFPGLNAFTREEFVRNNLEEMRTGLLPILSTIAVLGAMTGGAVLTLLLYGGVLEKRADYALLKAIGASHRFIVLLVVRQSLVAVATGLAFGALAYAVGVPILTWLVPEIALAMTLPIALSVALAALAIGGAGAWLPIRKLRQIYPAEVFRA
jgi:putative ABC transport system permease protein